MAIFGLFTNHFHTLQLRLRVYRERQVLATLDRDALKDIGVRHVDAQLEAAMGFRIPNSRKQQRPNSHAVGKCRET